MVVGIFIGFIAGLLVAKVVYEYTAVTRDSRLPLCPFCELHVGENAPHVILHSYCARKLRK